MVALAAEAEANLWGFLMQDRLHQVLPIRVAALEADLRLAVRAS